MRAFHSIMLALVLLCSLLAAKSQAQLVEPCSKLDEESDVNLRELSGEWIAKETYSPLPTQLTQDANSLCLKMKLTYLNDTIVRYNSDGERYDRDGRKMNDNQKLEYLMEVEEGEKGHWHVKRSYESSSIGESMVVEADPSRYFLNANCLQGSCGQSQHQYCIYEIVLWTRFKVVLTSNELKEIRNILVSTQGLETLKAVQFSNRCNQV